MITEALHYSVHPRQDPGTGDRQQTDELRRGTWCTPGEPVRFSSRSQYDGHDVHGAADPGEMQSSNVRCSLCS